MERGGVEVKTQVPPAPDSIMEDADFASAEASVG